MPINPTECLQNAMFLASESYSGSRFEPRFLDVMEPCFEPSPSAPPENADQSPLAA